jgi:phosphatidylglycerophosphatase A
VTRLAVFLATAGYTGYFPLAPGTVGSVVGLVLYGAMRALDSPNVAAIELALIAALFAAGVWAGTASERHFGGTDPGPVVIDEVAGMLITLAFIPVGVSAAIAGFLLFRLFDIIKPFPAGRLEALHGGLGIMSDDAMAGIYANISLRLLMMIAPGWVA